jgi:hypothetical protein
VAGRIEGLADHQPARVRVGDEDVVHLPRVGVPAARVDADIVRTCDAGRSSFCRGRREDDRFDRLFGCDSQLHARRQVERARAFAEHAAPRERPFTGRRLERTASFLQHDDGFLAGDLIAMRRACREAQA